MGGGRVCNKVNVCLSDDITCPIGNRRNLAAVSTAEQEVCSRQGKHSLPLPPQIVIFVKRYGKDLNTEGETFNAGVCGMNLERWRNDKIYEEVEYWMKRV